MTGNLRLGTSTGGSRPRSSRRAEKSSNKKTEINPHLRLPLSSHLRMAQAIKQGR
jgi:hypothetical protein